VGRDSWAQTSVQAVMRPLSQLQTVAPDTPALQALETMSRLDINQLPVLSNGHLEGIFSRTHVLSFLQNHAELSKQ
jgi:CBS domain-containing protein